MMLSISWLLLASLFAAAPTHQSAIRWFDCRDQLPQSVPLEGVDLTNLPEALKCGRIDVPMDYKRPMGSHNNITLGLAMYRPRNPKGVIFL
jgi:hypothetical protein